MSTLYKQENAPSARPLSQTDRAVLEYMDLVKKDYYDEEISEDSRFPVWYQLSSLRTGLLSWYEFKQEARVLEIGAGFGALTGLLCDRCSYVAATERSVVRAEALARRWEDKGNLHVYAGEWSERKWEKPFDYIILTGILERACGGSKNREDYVEYLKKIFALLKKDGILLLAADNRLGLKYFCGARESHGGNAFEGINHYPNGTRGYSFDRAELKSILARAGFGDMQFYYPLPDYKMPQLIYSDNYLPKKNIKERLIPYYENHNSLVAMENELYDDVIENGVFPFFANSFLIECSQMETGESEEEGKLCQVVYAAVSTDRGRGKSYVTAIKKGKTVTKTPLFEEGKASARQLFSHIEDLKAHQIPVVEHTLLADGSLRLPYVPWPTLSNYIKEVIKEDPGKFLQIVDQIYAYILASSERAPDSENALLKRIALPKQIKLQGASAGGASSGNPAPGNPAPGNPASENPAPGNPVPEDPSLEAPALDFGPILKKAYMELIPLNCFYHPQTGEFLYFDQEFVRENYPAKYVLFRAIHYIYCFTPDGERYYPRQKLIRRYGMEDTWDIYQEEENRFLDQVRNHKKYGQFYRWASVTREKIQENIKRLRSEEEVIADYKISDKMKKIWKVELSLLAEVDRICKKYGFRYFLVHGSLLGAVRHKGFIPWDDDLDIAMPRKDYDGFLKAAEKELAAPLSLHTPETEKDMFWGGFARVRNAMTTGIEARDLNHKGNLGIWIDILPLDVCTMDEALFEKKKKEIRRCHRLLLAKIYGNDYPSYSDMKPCQWKMYKILSCFYSHDRLCRMLDRAMRRYTDKDSEDVAFFSGYYMHRRLNAADFQSVSFLEFEQQQVPVPAGYDNYLFMSMGKDYRKYPPEDERKPKHTGIFDPEKPYGEYQRMLTGMFEDIRGKKIIIFGAGMMFEDYMKKWGGRYRPDFLTDNDEHKWGRQRMGIPVRPPKQILEVPEEKRRVIICSFYYKEIERQLAQMGIKDYRVYVQHVDWIIRAENQ